MVERSKEPKLQLELLKEVYRFAKIGFWEVTADEELLWSDETLRLFGLSRSKFSDNLDDFYQLVHPDDLENLKRISDFQRLDNEYFKSEYRIVRPDGKLRHIQQTAIVLRDDDGNPQGFSGVVQDVTDQVTTEAKLRQAQKMETIGQLSGGVAHDFNNLLATIMGAAELLQFQESYEEELVESIIKSSKRGGELTHRLLAFARKQPLQTKQVDVIQLVVGMSSMLDRLIGQDIKLLLETPKSVWALMADPAQLEEALLNLVVNARDAIEGAGTITISCRNTSLSTAQVLKYDYVEVIVKDTGQGMSDVVRTRACEPFFTTKPVGKGSGLGLSMVEGFVKQSGGQMQIRSTPETGTEISILMPRAIVEASEKGPPDESASVGQGESILVIEDNIDLAALLARQLTSLNFRTTLATNRKTALQACIDKGGFDIVLSDILLADGERGPKIVEEIVAIYPNIRPIWMTGFTDDTIELAECQKAKGTVLQKPFDIKKLAAVIQNSMDDSDM